MLGIIGIMGCIILAVGVGLIVGAAMGVTEGIIASEQADAQSKANGKLEDMQLETNAKALNRDKATQVLQEKIQCKNLLQTRQAVGTGVATAKLMTERYKRQAGKENALGAATRYDYGQSVQNASNSVAASNRVH
jgi:hypothetical protein